ncbi:MAG: hypothetical protein MSA10_02105, partial [Paraprevotella sp.]|nr:hypothetical protein [Paraprevotella sp.]
MIQLKSIIAGVAILFLSLANVVAADQFVTFDKGDIRLCSQNSSLQIAVSDNDNIGVKLALKNLCNDFKAVNGSAVTMTSAAKGSAI